MKKRCIGCNQIKPIEDYWKNNDGRKSGTCSRCIPCSKVQKRAYYLAHRDVVRAKTRQYWKTSEGKATQAKVSRRRYQEENTKWRARGRLRDAVRYGKIEKMPCFCGEVKVYAHHYLGYEGEHWKDVKWLCYYHHAEEHEWKGIWKRE